MRKKETELKVKLTPEEFFSLAPKPLKPSLEKTFGYFKENFSNIQEGIFPRIKYIKKAKGEEEIILTVKNKTKNNNKFFEREETEIKIKGDEETVNSLREIIKLLGFSKEIIFEKKRKNIVKNDITISFDELPFGFFIELEGKPKKIEQYLKKLKLVNKPRITKAYLALWEDYKNNHQIREENCIFE
jgi:adenylate cyclase class IV